MKLLSASVALMILSASSGANAAEEPHHLRVTTEESATKKGCGSNYGGCNDGGCTDQHGKNPFDNCSKLPRTAGTASSLFDFFEEGGKLYGTAAAGVVGGGNVWTKCGQCYDVTIGNPKGCYNPGTISTACSAEGTENWGCTSGNTKILGEGKKATIMVINRCSECVEGHFDLCDFNGDHKYGGTSLSGIDNPMLTYAEVECPSALLNRLGCPTTWPPTSSEEVLMA